MNEKMSKEAQFISFCKIQRNNRKNISLRLSYYDKKPLLLKVDKKTVFNRKTQQTQFYIMYLSVKIRKVYNARKKQILKTLHNVKFHRRDNVELGSKHFL